VPSATAQPPAAPPALSADRLVDLYHQMWRIRLLETSVVDLYQKGLVRGSAHPYSICENNLWALSTPTSVALSVPDVALRGPGFGMPGVVVDGHDVCAVYGAVAAPVARARAGAGPSLLECKSYRFHTHSAFATREPRPTDEIATWKARDPISLLGTALVDRGVARDALAAAEADERALLEDAVSFAIAAPAADPAESLTDVFSPALPRAEATA